MNIANSNNPRHVDALENLILLAALGLLIAGCLVSCRLPDIVEPDDNLPGTTTTTTSTSTTTTTQPDNAGRVLPQYIYGGAASPGEWPQQSAGAVADAVQASGCNLSGCIELIAPAFDKSEDGYNGMPMPDIIMQAAAFIRVQQAHGLWTMIHTVNGNDEVWQQYSQGDMRRGIERLFAECGTAYIILVPVAEMETDDDTEFAAWAVSYWAGKGGICGWNGRGRPTTVPAGVKVLDYHTQDTAGDFGPTLAGILTILDTDNRPAIDSLRAYWNAPKVEDWARAAKAHGKSIVLYAFQTTEIDAAALEAVADAYNP